MNPSPIDAAELHALLDGPQEVALVDVREVEDFQEAHIYHAAYLPASWTENRRDRVAALVPRRGTTVVLTADAPLVDEEADRWISWGYNDIRVYRDGVDGWLAHGGRVFRNLCVPSKALAETARHRYGTPAVSATDLAAQLSSSTPPLVVDVRSEAEYAEATIPDAIGLPGGELVARIGALLPDPHRRVVVTCADRTRAIFGAESLRWWGLRNPVSFLEGGITAWADAGFDLHRGRRPVGDTADLDTRSLFDHPSAPRVEWIDRTQVETLLAEPGRTTYVVDPRLVPGARPLVSAPVLHVPGGQYVEAIDEYTPVLRSRVVLVDDAPHTRALALARWLRASRLVEVYLLDAAGADGASTGTVGAGAPIPPPSADGPEPAADGDEMGVHPDARTWSLALPALARVEAGQGFAL